MNKYIKFYYKKFFFLFLVGIVCDIVIDYLQLYVPEYLGRIVDIVKDKPNAEFGDIRTIVFSLVVIGVLLYGLRILMRFGIFKASEQIEAGFRHQMFNKAERLSQRFYHENKVGSIMSWFTTDLEAIEEYVGWGTVMIVDALFLSIMTLFKMVKLDWLLSLVVMVPMVAIVVWGNLAERLMYDKWMERQGVFDKMYDYVQENFTGIRVIKAFVKEVQEFRAFSRVARENADKNIEFARLHIVFDVCIELIIGVIMALVLGLGSYFVYSFVSDSPVVLFGHVIELSVGDLTAFTGYVDTLIWPMIALGQIVQMRSRFKASLARISAYLDEDEEVGNKEGALKLENCVGNIEFRNFSFNYPDSKSESLSNVNLGIRAGELIGVVGKIGCGKTTLVNSLLRLYNVEPGSIFIDGVDIMDLDIQSLRDNVSYVPQDNFLFSDSVANNIAFSNRKLQRELIYEAAKFADVDDNIRAFSDGYDTLTGERGVTMSGGQKQRVSIARAYIKNAPIMILDDAVSAVDVKTEETILHNIREKRANMTTIIIASRVSTVSHLDKIIVLNDGRVEAFDMPDNLLNVSPTYQRMVFLQKLESEL